MNDPPKKKLGPKDLNGFGRMAEEHWRRHRPKMVKALARAGLLYEHLVEAGERAEDLCSDLEAKGVPSERARELALHDFILLPDSEP